MSPFWIVQAACAYLTKKSIDPEAEEDALSLMATTAEPSKNIYSSIVDFRASCLNILMLEMCFMGPNRYLVDPCHCLLQINSASKTHLLQEISRINRIARRSWFLVASFQHPSGGGSANLASN